MYILCLALTYSLDAFALFSQTRENSWGVSVKRGASTALSSLAFDYYRHRHCCCCCFASSVAAVVSVATALALALASTAGGLVKTHSVSGDRLTYRLGWWERSSSSSSSVTTPRRSRAYER